MQVVFGGFERAGDEETVTALVDLARKLRRLLRAVLLNQELNELVHTRDQVVAQFRIERERGVPTSLDVRGCEDSVRGTGSMDRPVVCRRAEQRFTPERQARFFAHVDRLSGSH